jgi:hypothetical protein
MLTSFRKSEKTISRKKEKGYDVKDLLDYVTKNIEYIKAEEIIAPVISSFRYNKIGIARIKTRDATSAV